MTKRTSDGGIADVIGAKSSHNKTYNTIFRANKCFCFLEWVGGMLAPRTEE